MQHDEALVGPRRRDGLAVVPLGLLGEPEQEVGAVLDLGARGAERLALLFGHGPRQVLLALDHQVVGPAQDFSAVIGRGSGPVAEGAVGGVDGATGRLAVAVRHFLDGFAGRRIDDGEGLARGRLGPCALNEHRSRSPWSAVSAV
jgi:hypothetical protein